MGKGNVSVGGPYEGLYYIDNDYFHVYRLDSEDDDYEYEDCLKCDLPDDETTPFWYLDEECTELELEDIERCITDVFCQRFPSFESQIGKGKWIRAGTYGSFDRIVLAESNLFYLCAEDNEWSEAVELIQKECWYDDHLKGPQKRLCQKYLDGLLDVMLERLPSVGTYGGPWTSGRITREERCSNA